MKKQLAILGMLLMAIAICLVLLNRPRKMYTDFSSAERGIDTHITGKLDHQKPILQDNNYYSFWMTDKTGIEKRVIVTQPMPQDFERAENLVIKGFYDGRNFHANEVLIKCHSGYACLIVQND